MLDSVEEIREIAGCFSGADVGHAIRLSDRIMSIAEGAAGAPPVPLGSEILRGLTQSHRATSPTFDVIEDFLQAGFSARRFSSEVKYC